MQLNKVMIAELVGLCVAMSSAAPGELCERGRTWLDRGAGACAPCTRCDPATLAVRLPCEPHRDTVCQLLQEIRLWPPQNSDYYYDYTDYDSSDEDSSAWTEAAALSLAVSGCVVFFVVVVALSLYHAKQWRVIKKALKSDMRELTAKLKLIEAGAASQPQATAAHLYCNIHPPKLFLDSASSKHVFGNVYTQNKAPT